MRDVTALPPMLLKPIEPHVVQLCLVSRECECADLVAQALGNRPELRQNRYLVGEVLQLMRREKFAPLVPSVILGASYGGFGGGRGARITDFSDRVDLDAVAFWELRNLGFGQAAARNTAESRLRQAQIQELAALDLVAREVTEAQAQVQIREQQLDTARDLVKFAGDSYAQRPRRLGLDRIGQNCCNQPCSQHLPFRYSSENCHHITLEIYEYRL